MNRPGSYKYLVLLVTLLLLIATYPVLRGPNGSRLLLNALVTVVLLACARFLLSDRRLGILGIVLVVPAIFGAWTGYAVGGISEVDAAALFHVSAAAFQVLMVVVVVRAVSRQETVTADAIAGALCGYILIGVAFGHVYCVLEVTGPGMFAGIAGTDPNRLHFLLTYFSFVTLTTVGYGDITPTADIARSLCIVEATLGQFYLAVQIAGLVGKAMAQASKTPP